jgi:hypothetical protein
MHAAWLASEHSRIHVIEQWPEGPRKEAALAAARSTMDSLLRSGRADVSAFHCTVCASGRNGPAIVEYPATRLHLADASDLAA